MLSPEDLLIVSFPRSGSTWVRFMLANLIVGSDRPLGFETMEEHVPDLHTPGIEDILRKMPPGRLLKSHSLYDQQYKRVVYLVRDGRDTMVSYYHYHCPHNLQATFIDFLRIHHVIWPGAWHRHVESWLDHKDGLSLLLVRYEDLLTDPDDQLRRIADFAALPADQERIAQAVRNCEFATLQKIETEKGGFRTDNPGFRFFRTGRSGTWKEYFGPEHKELFKRLANPTLLRLGYVDGPNW